VTPAVYSTSSSSYYAVVQQTTASSSDAQTLLSWPATTTSGILEQLANRHVLTGTVHSLHATSLQASASTESGDGSSAVAVVYSDGGVAFGAQGSKGPPARPSGFRVLSANADAETLAVVCTVKGSNTHQVELYDLQVSHFDLILIPTPCMPIFCSQDQSSAQQECMCPVLHAV